VAYSERMQVGESFEELVHDYFGLEVRHAANGVAFDPLEEVLLVVPHDDVEVLVVPLLRDVAAKNLADELVLYQFYDLYLPISVSGVLQNPFDCHDASVSL
jgi:hypothetical protein